ncbi:MAG TPA: hypothetical protein VFZ09_34775 [Archangium sp.]|uniref:hypothetical protein n=1 Tax=Archangium sp. TaxID=1872627 RepID=UPI002E31F25F|nr:hypothetical protein [Archangium sp.]HEX5751439.1 hypothetical protein [Archangium sp.]
MLFIVALWGLPSGAQVLELYRPLAPPPSMPERPAFEELLFSFADPDRALEGGFLVPSLSLAVRSRAWAFIPSRQYEQRDALDTLSQPAQDLTLSELPAGRHLASLLALGPEGGQVRIRDLGPRLRGPDSPLQKGFQSALDYFHVPKPAAMVSAGVAVLGLVHQFGTAQANELGLPTSVSATTLGGTLNGSIQLHSEPRFKNARADMSARFRLPELPLTSLRFEQMEVGCAAARSPEGLLLDTRWATLRSRLAWLELSMGVHSTHAEPQLWTDLETSVQREGFSVRAVFSRQWETARFRSLATATLRTGPVLSGLFMGLQDNVTRTFGLVGMGSF